MNHRITVVISESNMKKLRSEQIRQQKENPLKSVSFSSVLNQKVGGCKC